jgi:predicted Zn-dependent protease
VDAGPVDEPQPVGAETYVEKGAGTVTVVDVTSPVAGSGPLKRFAVEIEDGIGVDGAAFSAAVRATLSDPRSWGSGGRYSFQQVGAAEVAAGQYDFKVALISPGNVDAYCPGLRTNGYTSCRVGERAVINLARWATAVPHYDGDIALYRHYVVNHEVGHALGNGHQPCPGAGAVAPVMLQQTLGLDGCIKNAWPYP